MRRYPRLAIVVIFAIPILSGCLQEGSKESTADTSDIQNSELASTDITTSESEVATSIDTAITSISFGGATFDTATWK